MVIDTKSGLAQIRAKVLIDATGDADLVYRAGGGYTMGDNGTIQNPTAMFRLGGVDTARFSDYWGAGHYQSRLCDGAAPRGQPPGLASAPGKGLGSFLLPGPVNC